MPYVQSEGAILYLLHRGACSRGLQAERERELVLGLYAEWRELLEILISGSEEACVTERCALLARVSVRLFSSSLEAAPVTPFYSRREAWGQYMGLLRGVV